MRFCFPYFWSTLSACFSAVFRSRRVRRTTSYLSVYEPVLYEILGFADGVIGRTSIRDDRLPSFRVMKHEIIFSGKFAIHIKVFQVVDVVILTFSQVFVDTLAVEVVVGSVRQPRVFVLLDRLEIFVGALHVQVREEEKEGDPPLTRIQERGPSFVTHLV